LGDIAFQRVKTIWFCAANNTARVAQTGKSHCVGLLVRSEFPQAHV
jgi:hypothetical protein